MKESTGLENSGCGYLGGKMILSYRHIKKKSLWSLTLLGSQYSVVYNFFNGVFEHSQTWEDFE